MTLKCPNCQSENIKSSRRRGIETISPGQPYRCRECQVRFHVFKTILGRPFFWVAVAACLVFLLFSYQVISRMELQGEGDSMVEEKSKGPGAGQHAVLKWQGGQRDAAVKQEFGPLEPQPIEKKSPPQTGTSKVSPPKPVELSAGKALKDMPGPAGETSAVSPPQVNAQVLHDITAQRRDSETRIMIQAGSPIKAYKYFSLNAPKRLVVDLIGKWKVPEKQRFEVKNDMVKGIRLGHYPDRLRIVVDLPENATNRPVINKISGGLVLTIPGKSMD